MFSMLLNFTKNRAWKHCKIFSVILLAIFALLAWQHYNDKPQVLTIQVYSVGQSEKMEGKAELIQNRKDFKISMLNDTIKKQELPSARVVLGAVSCRNKSVAGPVVNYSEGTIVMIKSVLISAKLYNISAVDLHLFLEHPEDEEYFVGKLKEMGYPFSDIDFVLITHSAVNAVPEKYWWPMVYHDRYRCGYVRFFFPTALPNVDSIIHLDSDMIITGNLWEIWKTLSQFQGEQLIGAARGNEAHDVHYLKMHQIWFGDIPHPLPKGINAGLLVMNLTKMRDYDWENKFVRVYDEYSTKVNLTGQRTVNVLFGTNPGILKMLSCQYNFFHRHCDKGFTCRDAAEKNGSIYLVHGNGFKMESGETFSHLFKNYQAFDLNSLNKYNDKDRHDELVLSAKLDLMTPIRKAYRGADVSKCYGVLNHLLFRDFFTDKFTLNDLIY